MRIKKCLFCGVKVEINNSKKLAFCSLECRVKSIAEPFKGNGGCWQWPKSKTSGGYGQLVTCKNSKVKVLYAHRLSFEILKGKKIPDGLYVCHHCDNRSCFNPEHLFLGTAKDNARDMISKGRNADFANNLPKGENHVSKTHKHRLKRGSSHYASKLSEHDVLKILRSKENHTKTAKMYGVTPTTICDIRKRKTWKHVLV